MKILIITLLLFSISCSKNNPEEPTGQPPTPIDTINHIIGLGKASVLRNGVLWNAAFKADYHTNDKKRISIVGKLKQNGFDHSFSIDDISCTVGLHPLERWNLWNLSNGIPDADYFIVLDGDQLLNTYSIDSTLNNQYIEILYYDSINHIVEGRFQTFLEGPNSWSMFPDSMKMTEGKFHLKLKE